MKLFLVAGGPAAASSIACRHDHLGGRRPGGKPGDIDRIMAGSPGDGVESWVRRHPLRIDAPPPGFEPSAEIRHAARLGGRAVDHLARIVTEVEKLEAAILEVLDELPVSEADRAGRAPPLVRVMGLVPEQGPRSLRGTRGDVGEITEVGRLGRRDTGQPADRRNEIPGRHRRGLDAASPRWARPAHQQRHAHATVVEESLAGPVGSVEGGRGIPHLRHVEPAVVGGEGDERRFGDAGFRDRREDVPHGLVERGHHRRVRRMERPGMRGHGRLRRGEGHMGRVEADDEEKRFTAVFAGLVGDDPGCISGLTPFSLPPLRRLVPGIGSPGCRRGEAPIGRQSPFPAEVPLADEMTPVSGRCQPLGECGDRRGQGLFDRGGEESVTGPIRTTRQEGGQIRTGRMDARDQGHTRR
jgi:hypothetical protein